MGVAAFKADETEHLGLAGSIPVRLRQRRGALIVEDLALLLLDDAKGTRGPTRR